MWFVSRRGRKCRSSDQQCGTRRECETKNYFVERHGMILTRREDRGTPVVTRLVVKALSLDCHSYSDFSRVLARPDNPYGVGV
jgi:hypothetical protein